MKNMMAIFISQISPDCVRINLSGPKSQKLLCCIVPPLVIFSKRNPEKNLCTHNTFSVAKENSPVHTSRTQQVIAIKHETVI